MYLSKIINKNEYKIKKFEDIRKQIEQQTRD